jgi:hypothetical protein
MLTLKALYDPKTGLHFDKSVQINQPVQVLITILDNTLTVKQEVNDDLLQKLNDIHQISYVAHRSEQEIENYIQANRDHWD